MDAFFVVIAAMQGKHFLCDYVLQRHGSRKGSLLFAEWFPDLLEHAAVHGVGTFLVCVTQCGWGLALQLGLVDVLVHFVVDKAKVEGGRVYGWTPKDKAFWVALGADQWLHHLTSLVLGWVACGGRLP